MNSSIKYDSFKDIFLSTLIILTRLKFSAIVVLGTLTLN